MSEISIHTAHPGSGLWRLVAEQTDDPPAPYWAYPWAGGAVLARHFLQHPEVVRGKRVLDLGSGSGLVGIAAMMSGAKAVTASEIDANGRVAIGLNAAANGAVFQAIVGDLLAGDPVDVDLVAVGDLFYNDALLLRVGAYLTRSRLIGQSVLVGDPGRAPLPLERLQELARYQVPDFGDARSAELTTSAVYAYQVR